MKKTITTLAIIFCVMVCSANNLQITGITVTQATLGTGTVTFNVSWNNSWFVTSTPNNWDAVWLFVKWNLCSNGTNVPFTHGALSATTANHSFPAGTSPMTSVNGTSMLNSVAQGAALDMTDGIMLAPNSAELGTMTGSVTLMVTNLPATGTAVSVSVFGTEMVYVPTGSFQIGDANGASSSNYSFNNTLVEFSAPRTIAVADETGVQTYYLNQVPAAANLQIITGVPGAWPKGYYGFYCMKYEITEDMYTAFLNNVGYTSAAATARYPANYLTNRNYLNGGVPPYVTTRNSRPQSFISWEDCACYLAWSCLRPMSEFEYEKAARGTSPAALNDYAWGSVAPTQPGGGVYTFSGAGTENGTETIMVGNCVYNNATYTNGDGGTGMARAGVFATAVSSRYQAGASYYGILDLTGNLEEPVVGLIGDANTNPTITGANNVFTRTWGTGVLTANGGSDQGVANWPVWNAAVIGSNLTNLLGHKGGAWNNSLAQLYVSERWYIYNSPYSNRQSVGGGRGVR